MAESVARIMWDDNTDVAVPDNRFVLSYLLAGKPEELIRSYRLTSQEVEEDQGR